MNATMMTVNPFGENMYILWDETSHEAVVVDPGMMRQDERDMVTKFIADNVGLNLPQQVAQFHLKIESDVLTIDRHLQDGEMIPLGSETIQVLHVPGHSPGGLAFYLPQSSLLISGDTIFNGSVGRTDLMGGDMATLINSIREKILPLPDETVIASGHTGRQPPLPMRSALIHSCKILYN